ncbi:MAG: type IV pilin [Thaumarchaeota archaeon]|nr:type IV pilin [Nitrososphaerota archaeon]
MYGSRSGISPVMATVILVAIAIVIAIAVAFWATGLVSVFTRFEKIEITAAYYDTDNDQVVLELKNTGSASATIDRIFINGQPSQAFGATVTCGTGSGNVTLAPGDTTTCTIESANFVSGVTYEVAVHTASGKTYPAAVLIP